MQIWIKVSRQRVSKINERMSNFDESNRGGYDLAARIAQLEAEVIELKRQYRQLLSDRNIIIERLYVRRVDVKELQFKLDKISVDDLSGMLNVGVNSDGKMKNEKKS
jgi:hypothetical protein